MRVLRMPVCVVAEVSGAVTVAVALFLPWPGFASRLPSLHVALGTALPLFALAAGLLVFGRLRQCARLDELTHNGSGFNVVAQADGFGLTSMRDRAALIGGGDLWISSVPGLGTEVEVRL